MSTFVNYEREKSLEMSPFVMAAKLGDEEYCRENISHQPDRAKDLAMFFASFNGHANVVRQLLIYGVKMSKFAFCNAVKNNYIDIVQMFIHAGLTDEIMKSNALEWACSNGHENIVKLLIQAGFDVRNFPNALLYATHGNHTSIINILTNTGAVVSVQ